MKSDLLKSIVIIFAFAIAALGFVAGIMKKENKKRSWAEISLLWGLLLLILILTYASFGAFFWTGMAYRKGPPPVQAGYNAEFFSLFTQILVHIWFVTLPCIYLIGYGVCGLIPDKKQKKA